MGLHDLDDRLVLAAEQAAARLGREISHAADDPDEQTHAGGESGAPLPAVIWIAYANSAGEVSQRNITLRKVWRQGDDIQVQGWCHLRRTVRTFRADRIKELVCLATGECPDDPEHWLTECALFAGDLTPDFTPHALRLCRDELAVLAFMARADGVLDDDEIEIATDFVMMSTEKEVDRDKIKQHIRRLAPDYDALGESLAKLAQSPRDRWPALARALRRLMDADGMLPIEEQNAWSLMQQTFEAEREMSLRQRRARQAARDDEADMIDDTLFSNVVVELAARLDVDVSELERLAARRGS